MEETLKTCDTLGGNRTPDALLRTEALYPLSYQGAGGARRARPVATNAQSP